MFRRPGLRVNNVHVVVQRGRKNVEKSACHIVKREVSQSRNCALDEAGAVISMQVRKQNVRINCTIWTTCAQRDFDPGINDLLVYLGFDLFGAGLNFIVVCLAISVKVTNGMSVLTGPQSASRMK